MTDVTNRVDINRVLMQMRDMREQAQAPGMQGNGLNGISGAQGLTEAQRSDLVNGASKSDASSFSDLFKQAVESVNDTQMKSADMQTAYQMGDPNVDITQVMIQMQKATVSFEAMTQVRNRLVSAYQDIMNMPL
ncbi:MAG: flagellar hook-basal body complex protein FliE [Pseudohongiellaceae bacterium]|nr:flagellar hook-basal body complex protein FliE [Pseudohongiellaceae bacterium]